MPRDNIATTLQVAFVVIEEEFGVSPLFSAEDVAEKGEVDKLAMLTYLAQIHQALENEPVAKSINHVNVSKSSKFMYHHVCN